MDTKAMPFGALLVGGAVCVVFVTACAPRGWSNLQEWSTIHGSAAPAVDCDLIESTALVARPGPAWMFRADVDWVVLQSQQRGGSAVLAVMGDGFVGLPGPIVEVRFAEGDSSMPIAFEGAPLYWTRIDADDAQRWIADAAAWAAGAAEAAHEPDPRDWDCFPLVEHFIAVVHTRGQVRSFALQFDDVFAAPEMWDPRGRVPAETLSSLVPVSSQQRAYRPAVMAADSPTLPCTSTPRQSRRVSSGGAP